ncbi:MAG: phage tail protein I [Pseudomonadota bacterium]
MSASTFNPSLNALQFINEAQDRNTVQGRLVIGHDTQKHWVTQYELHWGRDEQSPIAQQSLIARYLAENVGTQEQPRYHFRAPLVYHFNEHSIPPTATHLLVFAQHTKRGAHLYARRPLVNQDPLLPPSASRLERQLAATTGRLSQLPVEIDRLWDASTCPAEFLPWLAWAISVDVWFDNKEDLTEQESRRRDVIQRSAFVHQHKGTRAAIQRALNTFTNVNITLTEWWQETPPASPHTFKLDLLVNENLAGAGNAELTGKLRNAIDAIKPTRSHYSFTLSTVQTAELHIGTAARAFNFQRFTMATAV